MKYTKNQMIKKQENIKNEMALLLEKRDRIDQRLVKLRGDYDNLQTRIELVGNNPDFPNIQPSPSAEALQKVEIILSGGKIK